MRAGFSPRLAVARRCLRCVAAVLALVTAACGPAPDRAAEGRIVLRYWDKWTGFEGEAMREVVNDFNASQDRIYVDFSSVSNIDRKVMLATAGGVPPDVAGLFSYLVPIYAENNALTPLDNLAADAGIRQENYIDAFWQLCTHRGHLWALPTTPSSDALVWNKKMFREVGLDPERPPRSIAELEEFNAKLTRYRPDGRLQQMGFLPQTPAETGILWAYWFGARYWDGGSRMTLDGPENIAAERWLQSYPDRFGADNLLAFQDGFGNFASPQAPFFAGRTAMELQGVWSYNFIKVYAPADFEWGVAAFPSVDPERLPNVTTVECDVLAIPRGAKHPREAFEFLRYVNSQGPMEKLCMGQLKFSPLRKSSPDFVARHPNPYLAQYVALAKSPHAHSTPKLTVWGECSSELGLADSRVWRGRQDAASALHAAQSRAQLSLDRQRERWDRLSQWMLVAWRQELQ